LLAVGEGDVLPALEMAIRFMETGQSARVWGHSKDAFGPGTRVFETTTVLPFANVMYEVAVRKIVMDNSRLNPYSTIQKSLTRKNIANDIYQHEWCKPPKNDSDDPSCDAAMTRAIRLYNKAAKEMETLLQGTHFNQVEKYHPQRIQSQQLLLDSLNNIVAVYMKQHEYHKAKQGAVEVLKQDPKNLKGILRAAKSALLDPASTMEEVKAALEAAESEITYQKSERRKGTQTTLNRIDSPSKKAILAEVSTLQCKSSKPSSNSVKSTCVSSWAAISSRVNRIPTPSSSVGHFCSKHLTLVLEGL
jgi:hypothetical protein